VIITEELLVNFVSNFTSFLIVMPGSPDLGPFYLIKGLLKVLAEYPWYSIDNHILRLKFFVRDKDSTARPRLNMIMLVAFSAFAQNRLPYHVAGGIFFSLNL
jgi:hypothetical protein